MIYLLFLPNKYGKALTGNVPFVDASETDRSIFSKVLTGHYVSELF